MVAWADGAVKAEGTLSRHASPSPNGAWQYACDLRPPVGVSADGVVVGSGTMTTTSPQGDIKVESGSYVWDVNSQSEHIQFDPDLT